MRNSRDRQSSKIVTSRLSEAEVEMLDRVVKYEKAKLDSWRAYQYGRSTCIIDLISRAHTQVLKEEMEAEEKKKALAKKTPVKRDSKPHTTAQSKKSVTPKRSKK